VDTLKHHAGTAQKKKCSGFWLSGLLLAVAMTILKEPTGSIGEHNVKYASSCKLTPTLYI